MLTTERILLFFLLVECQHVILYPIDQYFEDLGQCIPIKCINGVPPENCTTLCNIASFKTTCRPRTDNCLCLRPVGNGRTDLVSPDEVPTLYKPTDDSVQTDAVNLTDPADDSYRAAFFAFFTFIEPVTTTSDTDSNGAMYSEETTTTDKEATDSDKEDTERDELLNEIVNVHEGRLFWDFCYILTGLLLLMIGLILYEVYMCRKIATGGQSNGVEPLIHKAFSSSIFTVGNEKPYEQKITQ